MKKYLFIIIGIISILTCIYGLFRYGAKTWFIFLALGIYFLYKAKIKSHTTNNESSQAYDKEKTKKNSIDITQDLNKSQNNFEPDKSFTFPIVGVTFKNDDGSERQKLLRKILFKDAPFDIEQNVVLERYIWKDKPAYYVKVNNYIVGNISADFVWYFEKNFDRPYKIEYIKVYGGGNGKNYGAEIHGIYLDA